MATVRKARLSDLKDVEYICKMTASELARTDEAIGEAIAKSFSTYYIRERSELCFVLADNNDKAVGYILCEPDYKYFRKVFRKKDVPEIKKISKKDGTVAWFLPFPYTLWGRKYPAHLHIDILEEYQNKGYGSILMNSLLDELKSRKIKGIMLTTSSDNHGAIRFYKRFGFHTLISMKNVGVVMAKNLSK